MATAVFEIENPYPGRVTFLSAAQAVASHLGTTASQKGSSADLLPGMWIRGVNDQRERACMILDRVAVAQEGMPFYDLPESLGEQETVEFRCPEPYKSIAISGEASTVLGPRGELLSSWAEALMMVCFQMSAAMISQSNVS